jgi:hypothetical protein
MLVPEGCSSPLSSLTISDDRFADTTDSESSGNATLTQSPSGPTFAAAHTQGKNGLPAPHDVRRLRSFQALLQQAWLQQVYTSNRPTLQQGQMQHMGCGACTLSAVLGSCKKHLHEPDDDDAPQYYQVSPPGNSPGLILCWHQIMTPDALLLLCSVPPAWRALTVSPLGALSASSSSYDWCLLSDSLDRPPTPSALPADTHSSTVADAHTRSIGRRICYGRRLSLLLVDPVVKRLSQASTQKTFRFHILKPQITTPQFYVPCFLLYSFYLNFLVVLSKENVLILRLTHLQL